MNKEKNKGVQIEKNIKVTEISFEKNIYQKVKKENPYI
jgi:hypothetical protein